MPVYCLAKAEDVSNVSIHKTQINQAKAMSITVFGMVQGVGFRYYVFQQARVYSIGGWVTNMQDRTVVIHCEGSEQNMKEFLKMVEQGPSHAKVEALEVVSAEVEHHSIFRIV